MTVEVGVCNVLRFIYSKYLYSVVMNYNDWWRGQKGKKERRKSVESGILLSVLEFWQSQSD